MPRQARSTSLRLSGRAGARHVALGAARGRHVSLEDEHPRVWWRADDGQLEVLAGHPRDSEAQSLGGLERLQTLTLDLPGNSIGDDGCAVLARKLGGLQQLHSLKLGLYGNLIGDAGRTALAETLGGLKQLQTC